MRAHWSSVSSWNRDTIPGFQNPTGKFIRHALAWKFHLRSPKKEYSQQEALLDSGQEVSPALGPPVLQRLSS